MATTAREDPPQGPAVVSLPFLGRSWYQRGLSYWLRRALWSFCCLLILVMFSLMTGGLINAIATDSIPMWVRILALTLIATAIVHSMIKAWGAFNVVNRARKRGEAVSLAQASGDNEDLPATSACQCWTGGFGGVGVGWIGGSRWAVGDRGDLQLRLGSRAVPRIVPALLQPRRIPCGGADQAPAAKAGYLRRSLL